MNSRLLRLLSSTALLAALLVPASAAAQGAWWTTPALLKDFFRSSTRVSYVKLNTQAHAAAVKARLGYVPARPEYVIFVAKTGAAVDGYAVVDDEQGQHEPITFGFKLNAHGELRRAEVMVYREGQGEEIKEARFLKQFVGFGPAEPPRFKHDVDAISGATISSRSATRAVNRALALVEVARTQGALKPGSARTSAP